MEFNEMMEIISAAPYGKSGERVLFELRFAAEMSRVRGGAFDRELYDTAKRLCEGISRDECISPPTAVAAEQFLLPLKEEAKKYTLHCTGHAHMDMNWQWGFQETACLVTDTFRTVLRLMDEYPTLTFSQSQTAVYEIAETFAPDLFQRIENMIRAGRWEITASAWTEADKNLPNGESLARHILYTKKYFEEKLSIPPDNLCIGFEPDTFGHSAVLPEILEKSGIRYYYHARGAEGRGAYRWQSESGAELLCYNDPYWYSQPVTPDFFLFLPDFCKKTGLSSGLRVFGFGDHGGGPTRKDIELLLDMQKWQIAPEIRFSTFRAFFDELDAVRGNLPIHKGELNYIFTGCYSSQSRIKGSNRRGEDRLYEAETLSALARCYTGGINDTAAFAAAWKKLLFNQFHDILPGACVGDSRDHALGEIQNAMAYAGTAATRALHSLAAQINFNSLPSEKLDSISLGAGVGFGGDSGSGYFVRPGEQGEGNIRGIHLFNTTSELQTSPTEITVWDWQGDPSRIGAFCHEGAELQMDILESGQYWHNKFHKLLICVPIEPFGYTTVILREKPACGVRIPKIARKNERVEKFLDNTMENERMRAVFDKDMCLVSLVDKSSGRELVSEHSCFFEYAEESTRHNKQRSAWVEGEEIRSVNANHEGRVYVTQRLQGRLYQKIRYALEYTGFSAEGEVTLLRGENMLRFRLLTDWEKKGKEGHSVPVLRFSASVSYPVSEYKYEIPCGDILRPSLNHDAPARSFIYGVPRGGGIGLGLFTDSTNAFRGEGQKLHATLLRASTRPDPSPEIGERVNRVAVAILPDDNVEIHRGAALYHHPPAYVSAGNAGAEGKKLPLKGSFLQVEGTAAISAVKTPEDGEENQIIIRLYHTGAHSGEVKLRFLRGIVRAEKTDISENFIAAAETQGNIVKIFLNKGEIATLRIYFM